MEYLKGHMNRITVFGGIPLKGTVNIGGSKHSSLPILAATLLAKGSIVIRNLPDIDDVIHMLAIVKSLNAKLSEVNKNTLRVELDELTVSTQEFWRITRLRSTVLLLGSLLARTGSVNLPYPGGDKLGSRPMDEFLYVLEQFNISCSLNARSIKASLNGTLRQNRDIDLVTRKFPLMGNNRTVLALMLAWANNGRTVIRNALILPEIIEVCDFLELISNGQVTIDGIGTDTISLTSPGIQSIHKQLCSTEFTIAHDKCEFAFWTAAASLTRGDITLSFPFSSMAVRNTLRKIRETLLNHANIPLQVVNNNSFRINCSQQAYRSTSFELNAPYHETDGVAFDATPLFSTVLFKSNGTGYYRCGRFGKERTKWAFGLERVGASYFVESDGTLRITGVENLIAHESIKFEGTDIRGASALLLVALATSGHPIMIDGISHIHRGMEKPIKKLRGLGACISVENQETNT